MTAYDETLIFYWNFPILIFWGDPWNRRRSPDFPRGRQQAKLKKITKIRFPRFWFFYVSFEVESFKVSGKSKDYEPRDHLHVIFYINTLK